LRRFGCLFVSLGEPSRASRLDFDAVFGFSAFAVYDLRGDESARPWLSCSDNCWPLRKCRPRRSAAFLPHILLGSPETKLVIVPGSPGRSAHLRCQCATCSWLALSCSESLATASGQCSCSPDCSLRSDASLRLLGSFHTLERSANIDWRRRTSKTRRRGGRSGPRRGL